MTAKITKSSRFSWEVVPADIRWGFLTALYQDLRDDELPKVRAMSDEAVIANLEDRVGSTPKPRACTDGVYRVLRDDWLEVADAEVVDELTRLVRHAFGAAGEQRDLKSRKQQVAFLQERRLAKNFKENLRKAFVRAHKKQFVIESTPRAERELVMPVDIIGHGEEPEFALHDYQRESQSWLDALWSNEGPGSFGGVLVLPTGAGKTDSVADWLLRKMEADADLRVLWLVHRQELAAQAMERFVSLARSRPDDFRRRGRIVHSEAAPTTVLADPEVGVATVAYQSLGRLTSAHNKQLVAFCRKPVVVVVDEAHHAGSPTFDALLDLLADQPQTRVFIGLTATPYPSAQGAMGRFRRRFPDESNPVTTADLVKQGILARPVTTTIDTGHAEVLDDDDEVNAAVRDDLPPKVLARLAGIHDRNRRIVEAWSHRRHKWGKTLIFATNIDHADRLLAAFGRVGANCEVLHSRAGDRSKVLRWFRSNDDAVLVSVGMLTERVDLADARTAFIARPTTSSILMRQMVGRVLRGPAAGGDDEAHVVYFRDRWDNLLDVLAPEEVLPTSRQDEDAVPDGPAWRPGRLLDDAQLELRADLEARIRRVFEAADLQRGLDGEGAVRDHPLDPLLREGRIVGFYELPEGPIPVFDHQQDGYAALIGDALGSRPLRGTSFESYFDDVPPPLPAKRWLVLLVEFCRETGDEPELRPVQVTISPRRAAARVRDAGALTDDQRAAIIEGEYENSANRLGYRTIEAFEEAVHRMLRDPRREVPRLAAESALGGRGASHASTKPKLRRAQDRDLQVILESVGDKARVLLPVSVGERLHTLPAIDWTRRVNGSSFAHWTLRLAGRGKGRAVIRVNRLFATPKTNVPDEMLEYLVYHELLHDLLPGQGHDAEFRELEALWPDSTKWDLAFDTLHETWDIDPKSYR